MHVFYSSAFLFRKKLKKRVMKMEHVPEELLNQILLKLEAKDLLRFKSVCKLWYSLISSPSFITEHMEANKNNTCLIAMLKDGANIEDCILSILSHETLGVLETHKVLSTTKIKDIKIVGCCNGVVCVHSPLNDTVFLWNPTTRDTKIVPKANFCDETDKKELSRYRIIGFGFDAKIKDYKIVSIWLRIGKRNYTNQIKQIGVYSLKTESWRMVSYLSQEGSSISGLYFGRYTNGMYSWLGSITGKEIISFNISKEVFISTSLPNFEDIIGNKIDVVDGCLALVSTNKMVPSGDYTVWVLGEYGDEKSWIKLFNVKEKPVGFWRNYKFFLQTDHGEMFLYDCITQQKNRLPCFEGQTMLQVFSLRKSLVPVNL